ncbi:ABC transporter permease [Mucilaginibacter sp. BJC16-A38]|uniref:ABC transporter permease n=1 Tax=Mucilaginibacter phenanthrenivorans TaxID=1234842 RepID=UPI0021574B3A|nr:ABC transporter permease [Mucilaginibacter phenanthrenivorans]MCR8556969.1 ABC transporter permease [Mucilaginibacter phenanthrenivorans]
MNNFFLNTRAEFLKAKRTSVTGITLIAALFVPVIDFIICLERPDVMTHRMQPGFWLPYLQFVWKNTAAIIVPIYTILITSLIVQVEYRNNTWKQVYASPRRFGDIFFSKLIVIGTLVLSFFLLFSLFFILSGTAVGMANNAYHVSANPIPFTEIIATAARIYLGILPVMAIQYWLSLRFKNFATPLGIGMALWISGIVLLDWDKIIYYPYMYAPLMFFSDFSKHPEKLPQLIINSSVCLVIALLFGAWNIRNQKEKG